VNPTLLNWGPAAVIVGGYLLGAYFQNRRIDDLRAHVDKRIDDFRADVDKRIGDFRADVDKRIGDLGKRIDDVRDTLRAEIRASQAELLTVIEKNHSELMMKFMDQDHRLSRLETERRIVQ